jgi:L-amino acid N-acyltransferase YncA
MDPLLAGAAGEHRLREAAPEDAATFAVIYGHHVRTGLGSFEEVPPSTEEMGRRLERVRALGLPWLVAEAEHGGVGAFCYAGPHKERAAYRFTVEDSVYVHPRHLRRGLGRALLAAVVERCAALGYRQMLAVIGDAGNVGSLGLHTALGFREIGRAEAVGFKHGRWVDVVYMQRALGPGSSLPPEGGA